MAEPQRTPVSDSAGSAPDAPEAPSEQRLPIDIRTLLVGLRRRVMLVIVLAIASVGTGALAGRHFDGRVYEASTVLLYKPPQGAGPESDGNDTPSLRTLFDMVEVQTNIEEVRRQLGLSASLSTIARALTVEVPENSQLMIIKAEWSDPVTVANLANTMRDVFFQHQRDVRHQKAQAMLRDLEARLVTVRQQTHDADMALKDFMVKNHVVDLDKEAQWYLQQFVSVQLERDQADGGTLALETQQKNIAKVVSDLKARVATEEAQTNGQSPTAPAVAGPLPSADSAALLGASGDQTGRTALLHAKQMEFDKAKTLHDRGMLSDMDLERAKAAYEAERYSVSNTSPTAGLLKDVAMKELDVRLDSIAQQQKLRDLTQAIQRVSEKLRTLPLEQREFAALSRDVEARAHERERMEQFLSSARRLAESEAFDFDVVSPAKSPVMPLRSNRTLVFMAVSALGSLGGLVLAILLELGDRRIRSLAQADIGLKLPALGELGEGVLRSGGDRDVFVRVAQRLRASMAGRGARILVASAVPGEGASSVARHLAAMFGERGDRVLLIDARLRGEGSQHTPAPAPVTGWRRRLLQLRAGLGFDVSTAGVADRDGLTAHFSETYPETTPGLGDYLSGRAQTMGEVCHAIALPGVDLVPATGNPTASGLASPRMRAFLTEASARYDVVILDASPVLAYADAGLLAESAQGALLVVQANRCTVSAVAKAAERLATAGTTLIGSFVTDVRPEFLERVMA